jgi:hypothetical protein
MATSSKICAGFVFAVCAVVMTVSAGCDEAVDDGGASSESTVCTTVGTTSWWNQSFADQPGQFHIEFSATPSGNNLDAVAGLSAGPATKWAQLAAIVRFNPDGFIDARNGSAYAAIQQSRYTAGLTYWIRIDVDVQRHTYSAWASYEQGQYGSWNQIANNYVFRTEQASVTHLNNIAAFDNPQTGPGTLQICGVAVNALPPTGSGCVTSDAGGGFTNIAVAPGVNSMIVDVGAMASVANMDGVVGIANGNVDEYNDLAAAVRFYTNGVIEVRDGDAYRADTAIAYAPGEHFTFKFVVDLANKTYSVWAYPEWTDGAIQLARGYRFRTQQASVTRLDHVASVVASSSGRVEMCGPQSVGTPDLRYAHDGYRAMAPIGDGVVVSDGATTQRLDVNGKVVASVSVGGMPAADADGSVYVARAFNGTVTVDALSSTLGRRWSRSFPVDNSSVAQAAVAPGHVLVLVRQGSNAIIYSLSTADGSGGAVYQEQAAVALSSAGWVSVVGDSTNGFTFFAYGPDATYKWGKTIFASFALYALAYGSDGSIAFGGEFYGETNFGDQTLYPGGGEDGPRNAFLVALDPTGNLRFSTRTSGNYTTNIAINGGRIAASTYDYTQFAWISLGVWDTAGHVVKYWEESGFGLSRYGYAHDVALSSSGNRLYVNLESIFYWSPDRKSWPFFIAADL